MPKKMLALISIAFALFLWIVAAAPASLSFLLAVAAAVAWCRWLERRPEEDFTVVVSGLRSGSC